MRQAHAAMLGRRRHADPAALGDGAIAFGEPGRGAHDAVFQPRGMQVARAVAAAPAPPRTACPASVRIASTVSGVASAKRSVAATGAKPTTWSRRKRNRRRGRDTAWRPPGRALGNRRAAGVSAGRRRSRSLARRPAINRNAASRPDATTRPTPAAATPRPRHAAAALLGGGRAGRLPDRDGLRPGRRCARRTARSRRIFEAKGRPSFNPLIVHLADLAAAEALAAFDARPRALAAGVLARPADAGAAAARRMRGCRRWSPRGCDAWRCACPAHPVARALLRAFGGPVAAPSANPSGRISPTRAAHVLDGLAAAGSSAVVDGGACAVGVESTIVGLARTARAACCAPAGCRPRRRRPRSAGPLPRSRRPVARRRPGKLASHYAPRRRAAAGRDGGRGPASAAGLRPGRGEPDACRPPGDLAEAAANLFDLLRALDARGARIAVAPIPDRGWAARSTTACAAPPRRDEANVPPGSCWPKYPATARSRRLPRALPVPSLRP